MSDTDTIRERPANSVTVNADELARLQARAAQAERLREALERIANLTYMDPVPSLRGMRDVAAAALAETADLVAQSADADVRGGGQR